MAKPSTTTSARPEGTSVALSSKSNVIALPTAAGARVRQTPGRRPKGLLSLCEVRKRKARELDVVGQSAEESLMLLGRRVKEALQSGARLNPYVAGSAEADLFEFLRDNVRLKGSQVAKPEVHHG